MKKTPLAILVIGFLLTGCATTHPGKMGALISSKAPLPLKVSAERESSFSDAHYTFVTFTVESTSDDMVRVKSTDLNLDEGAMQKANVLVGRDLIAWADAYEEQEKKDEHNRKLLQLALIFGGLGLGLGGEAAHNNTLKIAGAGAAAGGLGWTLSSHIKKAVENAENPKKVPEEHLYSQFSVPAEKFVRKWAVIQTPKDVKPQKVFVDMTLEDGTEGTYAIEIN